jgi:hypothetical protein
MVASLGRNDKLATSDVAVARICRFSVAGFHASV